MGEAELLAEGGRESGLALRGDRYDVHMLGVSRIAYSPTCLVRRGTDEKSKPGA